VILAGAAAYLVDGLVLALVAVVLVIVVGLALRTTLVASLLLALFQVTYFVVSWRSSARATLGMRAFKLQIGRIDDGQPITVEAGIVRWFVLTGWTSVLSLVAALGNVTSVLAVLWTLILLVSIGSDRRRQGLHDKLVGTAIVRPVGQSDSAAWATLVLLIAVPVVLAVLAIVALIFLGAQVSNILSTVGQSVGQ